jgi:hypothetical protein
MVCVILIPSPLSIYQLLDPNRFFSSLGAYLDICHLVGAVIGSLIALVLSETSVLKNAFVAST